MKLFFGPEDFNPSNNCEDGYITYTAASIMANDKLVKEGQVVYSQQVQNIPSGKWTQDSWGEAMSFRSEYKALLINIEPIQKCTHPRPKVTPFNVYKDGNRWVDEYRCDCGAMVRPAEFVEV